MPLSNPFRRTLNRPSLRERAATLRASLSPTAPSPVPLPAPGSEEAMAAFHAACHQDTIRSQGIVDGYPELKRSPLEWWTADSLAKAMEAGEITPAECARLYPRATERELRLAEIHHDLNLGALHALAFADSYPASTTSEDHATDDARLIRFGRLFEAARVREIAACEACNAAEREANRHLPPQPDAVTLRASDHPLRIYREITHPTALDGRHLNPWDVEWLRRRMPMTHEVLRPIREGERAHVDHPGRRFDIIPYPEAQDRAEEIITAWDAWQAERARVYREHFTEDLGLAADTAGAATAALAARISDCSAHTAAGLRVKLRALSHYRRDALLAEIPNEPDPDQLLSHSIWRDMQNEPPIELDEPTRKAAPLGRDLVREAFEYAYGVDLSAVLSGNLIRLYNVFHREAELLSDVAQEDRFCGPGGEIVEAEQNRLACLRDAFVTELARRTPKTEADRDAALIVRAHHEMLCETKIRNKALLTEITRAWGG